MPWGIPGYRGFAERNQLEAHAEYSGQCVTCGYGYCDYRGYNMDDPYNQWEAENSRYNRENSDQDSYRAAKEVLVMVFYAMIAMMMFNILLAPYIRIRSVNRCEIIRGSFC